MIHVVEIPHQRPASAWFSVDKEDFIRTVNSVHERSGKTIFEEVTPRQLLLSMAGATPEAGDEVRDEYGWIFELAEKHGWDSKLFRADFLTGEGGYQTEPVTEFDACVGAVMDDLHNGSVFLSDEDAASALADDPVFEGHQGCAAREALRANLERLGCLPEEGAGLRP